MKKRLILLVFALCLCTSVIPDAQALREDPPAQENLSAEGFTARPVPYAEGEVKIPTYQEAYDAMIALKEKYPEGMAWTNYTPYSDSNYYYWKGGQLDGKNIVAAGCVAFAFELSDAAFGSLPARMYATGQFEFSDVKVGDILRVNADSHTVIVLQVSDAGVVIAEGNYSGTVHWGRTLSREEVECASHYITRYPENYIDPGDPSANENIAEGTAGALAWALTKAGTLTISGRGAMPDYSSASEQPWSDNADEILKIVIEDGVTRIGSCAFWQTGVLSAEIPDSVTAIGSSAFRGSSLISVNIPGSVETIGDSAFRECQGLSSATVSEGVETIVQNAFRACTNLSSISLPASIGEAGAGAFMECSSMTEATFAPGSKQVKIGDNLFTRCYRLRCVTLPQSIDCIGEGMFQNDGMLVGVEIPQGAASIGGSAFASSGVSVVIIPNSVKTIGIAAFSACPLSDIYFAGTEAQWKAVQKVGDTAAAVSRATMHYNYTYPGDHAHSWSAEWSSDETHHWHDCTASDCPVTENGEKDGYAAHVYDDETDAACNICGYIRTVAHTHSWSAEWSSDETHHWHDCTASDCPVTGNGEKDGYAAHVYDDETDAACNICGYIRTVAHAHSWSAEWSSDETHHWHDCTASDCPVTDNGEKDGYAAHVYDDETDAACNICGYIRTVAHTHSWSAEWSSDETHHWHDCTASDCPVTDNGEKDGYAAHVYDDETDAACNICGYIRIVAHTHSWSAEWSSNKTRHWHDCTASGCPVTENGEKEGYAAHVYDDETDAACNICGYIRTVAHTHSWSAEWSSNKTRHWHDCTASGCPVTGNGEKDGYAAHVYDDETDAACNICGYIRTVRGGSSSSDSSSGGGSSSSTITSTTRNPDGSITTKTENKATGTTTETTKNPDGSQIVVETRKDGTVTISETDAEGNKAETVANPDGSITITVVRKDGTTASVTTSASGQTEAEVALPAVTVSEAQRSGEAITLPIQGIRATQDNASAPAVIVKTGSTAPVKVEIPTENVTPGTVAVIVRADGSEEVIKTTVLTESGIAVSLPDGTTVKIVDNSKSFTDVPANHWASGAINFVSARELFSGTAAAAFTPEAPMTRAMLMTVLARYDGEDTSGGAVWYEKGMEWAVANGISDGSGPNDNITREQLVTMLWRYSGSPAADSTLNAFADAGEISGYAREAMRWAAEKGIITGFGAGQLNPGGQATRAEVAIMFMRYSSNTIP